MIQEIDMYSHLIQLLNVTLISGAISLSALPSTGKFSASITSPGHLGGFFFL